MFLAIRQNKNLRYNTPLKRILWVFLFFLSSFSIGLQSVHAQKSDPSTNSSLLHVHFINIGQGDSALIESPNGKNILVDSGPSRSWNALQNYLNKRGIKKIDLLINSHPHADHIGNAARIIENYGVKVILDSGFAHPIRAYRDLLDAIDTHKASLKLARKGRKINIGDNLFIEILGPQTPLIRGSRSDANSNSIIFKLSYGKHSILFTGDAEEETEQRLLMGGDNLSATILKVAHHGSRHASGHSFLAAVRSKLAVISCSQKNRYGHPAKETLHRLKQKDMKIWVTAQQGTLLLSTHSQGWMMKDVQANTSQLLAWSSPNYNTNNNHSTSNKISEFSSKDHLHQKSPKEKDQTQANECISINHADKNLLKTLPGIGKTLAQRIIGYRKEHKSFKALEDLRHVRGIGKKKLARILNQLCL
jgi:competence protein ComEC